MTLALPSTERFLQPEGIEGGRFSLKKLAELATRHRDDHRITAFVGRLMKGDYAREIGLRTNDMTRAGGILRARVCAHYVQHEVIWHPDKTGVEEIRAPYLLLPNGTEEPWFPGGDCDDKDTLILAMMLNACLAMDVAIAALGHGYRRGQKAIEHVLCAVAEDHTWRQFWRVDVCQDFEFGKVAPWEWERVILVPSQELVCDARTCLGTSAMTNGLAGLKGMVGDVEVMHVVSGVPTAPAISGASVGRTNELTDTWQRGPGRKVGDTFNANNESASWWTSQLSDAASALVGNVAALKQGVESIVTISKSIGASIPGWDETRMAQTIDAVTIAHVLATMLDEAAHGTRRVLLAGDGSGDWGLEVLPSDKVVIVSTPDGKVSLQDVATGAPASGAVGRSVGVLPQAVIVVVGALGFVAVHVAAAALVLRALGIIETTILAVTGSFADAKDAECIAGASPEACAQFKLAAAELEKQRSAISQSRARTVIAGFSLLESALYVGAGVILGGVALYAYNEAKGLGYVPRKKNPGRRKLQTREDIANASAEAAGAGDWDAYFKYEKLLERWDSAHTPDSPKLTEYSVRNDAERRALGRSKVSRKKNPARKGQEDAWQDAQKAAVNARVAVQRAEVRKQTPENKVRYWRAVVKMMEAEERLMALDPWWDKQSPEYRARQARDSYHVLMQAKEDLAAAERFAGVK